MLYVKKDKIKNLYPLLAAPDPESEDIKKFESLGTRSMAIEQAIGQAIDFHNWIGMERKQKRLWYLKNYWVEKIKDLPKVKIHTSLKEAFACGIGLFSIEGKKGSEISNYLLKNHRIHTVGIDWENIKGVRIAPNVYTTLDDLDRFILAIKDILKA